MAKRRRTKKMMADKKGEALVGFRLFGFGSFHDTLAKYTHKYAFKLGLVLALALGLASSWMGEMTKAWLFTLLAVCGLLGGFFNISARERKDFLMTALVAVLVLAVGGMVFFSQMLYVGAYVTGVINALLVFIVPATFVAALKHLFDLLA